VKIGTEDRKKLIVALCLMAAALVLLGRWLFTMGSSPAPAAAASASPSSPAARAHAAPRVGKLIAKPGERHSLDPTLRLDWLKISEDTKYEGKGRNIFRAEMDIPKPIVTPRTDKPPEQTGPPPPPPPPPINLKFFGFASKPGEPKRIFLATEGGDVFIAGEGDIIDRRYRVLRITPIAVEVEDVLYNNRQSIPLTQG